MAQFVSYGEMLIDLAPAMTAEGVACFVPNPGGAPANVAVQVAKLGVTSAFIGKVGDDFFGKTLKKTLEEHGVYAGNLTLDPVHKTTLAFVSLTADGDRDFSFYRNQTADTQMLPDDIDFDLVEGASVFCYGTLMMTDEPSKSTTFELLKRAKQAGVLMAYDPNWRPMLWADQAQGIDMMRQGLAFADVVKVSDEELALITETDDLHTGATQLLDRGAQVVVVTMGPKGCTVFTKTFCSHVPTYDTKIVDTTGSGDSFFGTFLAQLIQAEVALDALTQAQLEKIVTIANAAGSTCATQKGAIPAMPDWDALHACQQSVPLLLLD